MRRNFLAIGIGAALLATTVGAAVGAAQRPMGASDQCARFHLPKAAWETPQAVDYGRCGRPFVEAVRAGN